MTEEEKAMAFLANKKSDYNLTGEELHYYAMCYYMIKGLEKENEMLKEEMKQEKENIIKEYKATGREKEIQSKLIEISNKYKDKTKLPKDLCYLEGEDRENYLHDMAICQKFASYNRASIANIILEKMNLGTLNDLPNFQTIHNYISFEDNIVRKGAISAKKGRKSANPYKYA